MYTLYSNIVLTVIYTLYIHVQLYSNVVLIVIYILFRHVHTVQ